MKEVDFGFCSDGKGQVCIITAIVGDVQWWRSMWIPRLLALGYAETVNRLITAIRAGRHYESRHYARLVYELAIAIFPGFKEDDWDGN